MARKRMEMTIFSPFAVRPIIGTISESKSPALGSLRSNWNAITHFSTVLSVCCCCCCYCTYYVRGNDPAEAALLFLRRYLLRLDGFLVGRGSKRVLPGIQQRFLFRRITMGGGGGEEVGWGCGKGVWGGSFCQPTVSFCQPTSYARVHL